MESKSKEKSNLKGYFLPYLAPSHYIPLFQFAKLFASRGVHVTFVSTPRNSLSFRDSLESLNKLGLHIEIDYVDFPGKEVGLPEGIENLSDATSLEMAGKIYKAAFLLQAPIEAKVRAAKPDFIFADMHCFWATDLAAELGIPRLIYHARAYFALCAVEAIDRENGYGMSVTFPDPDLAYKQYIGHAPHKNVHSDDEYFLIPGLPHEISMTRSELPQWIQLESPYTTYHHKVNDADRNCYGAVVDSFYALEKDYIDYYRTTLGRRSWSLGPLFLHEHNILRKINPNFDNQVEEIDKHPCLKWLNNMPKGKVVYISFGTLARFSSTQLFEIASALESSDHPFIWVVRNKEQASEDDKWLPEGFEERILKKSNGVLIKGWAPQAKILEHPSIGGVVTHCGWNSSREAITAGLPMVVWPLSSEQFYHRKLFVDVLKIGVGIGNMKWSSMIEGTDELVDREKIEKAVRELMSDSEEAEERRRRAKEFGIAAYKAVEEGGSSYDELTDLIHELECFKEGTNNVVT